MNQVFELLIYGEPQQKGSMRAFVPKGWTRPVVTSTNRNLKAWEHLVRAKANEARANAQPLAGPIALTIAFYFQRPKRLLTKSAAAVYQPHVSAPDLSKLCRGLEDALQGILFLDDRQVAKLDATKAYAAPGEGSYCRVIVEAYYPSQLQFGEPVAIPAATLKRPAKARIQPEVGF